MKRDRNAQQPCAVVHIGEQQTEQERIEKLLQIGVVQRKQQGGNKGAGRLSVACEPSCDQTAEQQLLAQRPEQAHADDVDRERHRVYHIVHDRRGRAACDQTDEVGHGAADERADPHEGEADHRPPDERPRARQLFAERHGRHTLADAERRGQRNRVAADQNKRVIERIRHAHGQDIHIECNDAVLPRRRPDQHEKQRRADARAVAPLLFQIHIFHIFLPETKKQG